MKTRLLLLDFDDIRNPLLAAGQARATVEVGRRLAQKGYDITVLTNRYPGYKDRHEFGMSYKHIGLATKLVRLNNIFYFLSVPFHLRHARADIVVEYFTAPISTLLSPLFTKIPVVAVPTMFSAKDYTEKYHLPFEKIERWGCQFYRYFLPYTKDIDARMRKYNPRITTSIAPNGVANEYFHIRHKKPEYILYLGRFDCAQKGIDLLIHAYSRIFERIKYPLHIAGHGSDEGRLRSLITSLSLEKHVKIVGPLYGKKKQHALSEALFIAFPSRHDDFPIFSLEALASGHPLVTFDISEFKIFGKDISYKAKAFDIDEYARILLSASKDTDLPKKRLLCREFARQYTWDKTARTYDKFFRRILKN